MTNIGPMDQQIVFKSLTETNNFGQISRVYTAQPFVWGRVISQRGSEAFQAARTNAKETIRVCVRFRDDVTTKWHLVWDGQEYDITAVDRSLRRKNELWLTADLVGAL